MKRNRLFCLFLLLFIVFVLCSCSSQRPSSGSEPTPVPTAESTPTPTPEPTPIPFDSVAEQNRTGFSVLENADDLSGAMEQIEANAQNFSLADDLTVLSAARIDDPGKGSDYIASDGKYLYVLDDRELLILQLDGENTRLLSRTWVGISWSGRGEEPSEPVSGYEKTPLGLYCDGDRLAVTGDWYGYNNTPGDINYTEYTAVDIYDIKNPSAPRLLASFGQSGSPVSAGVKDGLFYLVTDAPVYEDTSGKPTELPLSYSASGAESIPYSDVYFAEAGCVNGCSVIGLYDLKNSRRVDTRAILGVNSDVYAADGKLFFYGLRTAASPSRSLPSGDETAQIVCTDIYCWSIDGESLAVKAVGTVNGALSDSGCLDLHNGVLRCLTSLDQRLYTSGTSEQWDKRVTGSALYLLDEELHPVGKIAADEGEAQLCWVGFMGDKAVMTSDDGRSVLADLLDPPGTPSALPGIPAVKAQAIRPYGETGCTAFYRTEDRKLELTVFDGNMKSLDTILLGSDHSSTLENLPGYTVDGAANIIAFSADDSYCIYGFDKKDGICFRSAVYLNDWAWNARGFSAGDWFYVADSRELVILAKSDLTETGRIYF